MSTVETKTEPTPNPESVVTQHLTYTVPFYDERQDLELHHCVQKMFVSSFYGNFKVYDKADRLIGTSENSKLSFLQKDLQTEAARVWYDAMCLAPEYKKLTQDYKVKEPALCFNFGTVSVEFIDAPAMEADRVTFHIPVFFNVTNVWDNEKKRLKF